MEQPKPVEYYRERRLKIRQQKQKRLQKRAAIVACFILVVGLIVFSASLLSKKSPTTRQGLAVASGVKLTKFASAEKTQLYLPFNKKKITIIGYHRAYNPLAVPMKPVGLEVEKDQTLKQDMSKLSDNWNKIVYVVMPRSGRNGPKNSAVDIGAPYATAVLAPASGRVVKIKLYKLYGTYSDIELHILPKGHPDRHLIIIHLDGLRVKVGDKIIAGKTVIGKVRHLSKFFHEQLADYIKAAGDHVQIQINRLDRKGNSTVNP